MPDLTIIYQRHCLTAESWSTTVPGSRGAVHTVSWGRDYRPDRFADYGWTCSCDAFKYGRGKDCKHIKEAEKQGLRCGWGEFWDTEPFDPVTEDPELCPKCGGPTGVEAYGV